MYDRGVRVILLIVALAGCDVLLKLEPVKGVDPHLVCSHEASPSLFCADFDEADPVYYVNGNRFPLPGQSGNVMLARHAPALSGVNSLWIDSNGDPGDSYSMMATSPAAMMSSLHASFSLAIPRGSSQDATLVHLAVKNTAAQFNLCYAELIVHTNGLPSPYLAVQSHCGPQDAYNYLDVFQGFPADLTAFDIDFDLAAGMTNITIGSVSATLDMLYASPERGAPTVEIGMLGTGGAGPELGLDDVVIAAQ